MKKRLLFGGIVVTLLVMLFSADAAMSSSHQNQYVKEKVKQSMLVYCVPGSGLPVNHSGDENAPHLEANPSFNNQPPTYFIRLHQQVLSSFKALFNRQDIEKYRLTVRSTFHSFFMALFRIVISPNAP
jgi:hypothetical protein